MPIPADQLPIGPLKNPQGGGLLTVFVDRNELLQIEENGPAWKLYDANLIPETIENASAIFSGLQRPGKGDGASCFSCKVSCKWVDSDRQEAPPSGQVFLVFVSQGFGGYVVFDWEWREEDPKASGHPVHWEKDFREKTWQKP